MAATITVNSLDDDIDDDGNCTLREAIVAANINDSSGSEPGECAAGEPDPVVDEVEFAGGVTGTISVSSPLMSIDEAVEINGPGAAALAIDGSGLGSGSVRILIVEPGGAGSTLSGLTIQNATTTTQSPLSVQGATTIRDCVFQDNRSDIGGAIRATRDLTIERSVFRRNTGALFGGGAVAMIDAERTLIVRDSLFEDNETLGNDGGAISVTGSDHVTRISGSTFQGNHSAVDGGAISVGGTSLALENSTFVGNTANRLGGAIEVATLNATLANLSVSENTADQDDDGFGAGGGIVQQSGSSTIVVRNSIIARNEAGGGALDDCNGSFTSDGYNLIGTNAGCQGFQSGVDGDQVGTALSPIDPLLSPLNDNGGPTPTLALQNNSPAVAAGNPMGCEDVDGALLLVDQRGGPRPQPVGTACDIGAYELSSQSQLTVTVVGQGKVTSTPAGIDCPGDCAAGFPGGSPVTLSATAAPGFKFSVWGGDCSGSGACQVVLSENREVIATFTGLDELIFSSRFEN